MLDVFRRHCTDRSYCDCCHRFRLAESLWLTDAMAAEKEERKVFPIWVDWESRIVSFQKVDGFEKLEYPTHDEMFQFAIEKSMTGFAIQ